MRVEVTNHSFVKCEKCGRIIAFEKDDIHIHEAHDYDIFSQQPKILSVAFIYCFCGKRVIIEELRKE